MTDTLAIIIALAAIAIGITLLKLSHYKVAAFAVLFIIVVPIVGGCWNYLIGIPFSKTFGIDPSRIEPKGFISLIAFPFILIGWVIAEIRHRRQINDWIQFYIHSRNEKGEQHECKAIRRTGTNRK